MNATPVAVPMSVSTAGAVTKVNPREQVVWVAGYKRVSTEGQAEDGFGLETQHKIIEDYIARFPNFRFAGWYSDEGVSGTKTDRKDFNRLLEDARHTHIRFVIVAYLNRQSREEYAGYFLDKLLEEVHSEVVSATQDPDPWNINKLARGIQRLMDAEDRRKILTQTNNGRQEAAEHGYWTGGRAPYGYQIIGQGKKRSTIAIHPDEAACRRRSVDLIVDDGLNVAEAMRQINSEGYRKRNGEEWDYFNFYRMLRDDAMRGVSVFRKVRATGKGSTRLAADGSPLLGATVTRQLPEIVPAARVALLDVALKRNGTGPRDSDAYLLSGHIIGECGAHYIGQFRDGVRKYMCTGHATPVDPNCNDPWLREDVTDEKVWEVLRPALEDEKQLQRWAAEWIAQLPKDRERHSTNVTALTAEVKKLRTQLEGLVIRIEDPEIDADERELLQASKTTLMSTWKLKKAELEQATELLTDYDAMKADIEMMAEAVQNARLRISEMTLQEKALLLDLCKVEVRIVEGGEIRAKTGLPSPAELWHIEQNVLVPDEPSDEAWQAAYDAIYPAGSKRRARANPETTKAYALAMLHRFRTGVTWSEAQPLYLPGVHWHTLASRQRKWWNDGTWKTLVTTLLEHGTGSPLGTPGRQKIVLEVTGLTLGVLVSDGFLTCLDSTVSPRVAELMRMCSFTLRTT